MSMFRVLLASFHENNLKWINEQIWVYPSMLWQVLQLTLPSFVSSSYYYYYYYYYYCMFYLQQNLEMVDCYCYCTSSCHFQLFLHLVLTTRSTTMTTFQRGFFSAQNSICIYCTANGKVYPLCAPRQEKQRGPPEQALIKIIWCC